MWWKNKMNHFQTGPGENKVIKTRRLIFGRVDAQRLEPKNMMWMNDVVKKLSKYAKQWCYLCAGVLTSAESCSLLLKHYKLKLVMYMCLCSSVPGWGNECDFKPGVKGRIRNWQWGSGAWCSNRADVSFGKNQRSKMNTTLDVLNGPWPIKRVPANINHFITGQVKPPSFWEIGKERIMSNWCESWWVRFHSMDVSILLPVECREDGVITRKSHSQHAHARRVILEAELLLVENVRCLLLWSLLYANPTWTVVSG